MTTTTDSFCADPRPDLRLFRETLEKKLSRVKLVNLRDLTIHPLAEKLPEMPKDQFDEMVHSITEDGLQEPLIIDRDNRILDGRHRYRALRILTRVTAEVLVADLTEREITRLIWALNSCRRHLDASQRGNMAVLLLGTAPIGALTDKEAADAVNIGERTFERAKKVQREGTPELREAVIKGEVTVSAAAEIATLPPEQQRTVVAEGPEAARKKAKEVREKKTRCAGEKSSKTVKYYKMVVAKVVNLYRELPQEYRKEAFVAIEEVDRKGNLPAPADARDEDCDSTLQWN